MSDEVKIKKMVEKIAEKEEEEDKEFEQAIQVNVKAVANFVRRGLGLTGAEVDQKAAAWLTTRIAELILALQHAPVSYSARVILTIIDALPSGVGLEVIKQYMERVDRTYKTVTQLVAKLAPRTAGMGGGDPMTSIMYMLAQEYITRQLGGGQKEEGREPVKAAPIPEELKRIIDELNAAEDKVDSS